MKRVLMVLTVLAMLLVAGAIPGTSEASSSDIILEDDFEIYSVVVPTFPIGWERLFAAESESSNNKVIDTTSSSPPNSFQVAGSTSISLAAEALYKLDATPAVIFLEVMVQASGRIKNYDGHESDIWVGFVTRDENIIANHIALFFNKDGNIYGTGVAGGILKEYTEKEWYKVKIGLDYTESGVVRVNYWIDDVLMGEEVTLPGPYRDYLEVGSGAEGKGWIDDIKVWTKGNEKPVAEAGDNATYTLGVSQPTVEVTLNGSNSTDSDGTIVAYAWTGTPDPDDVVGPNVTLGAGVHVFTLVVTDDDGAQSDPDTVTITVKPFPVSIDIKPSSDPNSINLKSKGVVPVAILTTPDFDATMVAPDTIIFGPAEVNAEKSALEDVNDDGELDMILHFRTQEIGLTEADTEVTLYGQTETHLSIIGVDTVSIVPPSDTGKGNKN